MSVFHVFILEFSKWLFCRVLFIPLWLFHAVAARCRFSLPAPSSPESCQVCFFTFAFKVDTFFSKLPSSKLISSFNCEAGAMPFHCRDTFASCFWAASLCLPGRPQWWIHCLQWYTIWFVCLPSELIFFTLWARIFIFQVLANRS